jgi:DNA-binding transcriptional regulator YhcF (GntR family)
VLFRSYDELGHAGLVVMQQGKGVFITARREATPAAVRRKAIADLARRLLAEASRMGAGTDGTLKIVGDVAREMESNL